MNIKKVLEEIELKKAIIRSANEFINKSHQDIAEFNCPFKVGEVVNFKHDGECKIERIFYCGYGGNGYRLKAFKKKNNGDWRVAANNIYDFVVSEL